MKLFIFLVIMLSSCGSNKVAEPTGVQTGTACTVVDYCTYAEVAGYQCVATEWVPTLGEGADLPASFYNGSPCVITSEDYQTDPSCDPARPVEMCGGGWNGGSLTPCCRTIQGPGPKSNV